jgi:hypothetical protein
MVPHTDNWPYVQSLCRLLDIRPPFMLRFVEWLSHWHLNIYNTREMLVLTLSEVGLNETLVS